MSGISVPCYGACGGDPKWRDPVTGFHCSLCGGSGKATTYDQRAVADEEWENFKASQKAKAEKRQRARGPSV
jgi:hypothetical protein